MKLKRFALVGVLSLATVVATVGVAGAADVQSSPSQTKPFWSAKVHQKENQRVEKDLGRGKISPFGTAADLLGIKPEELQTELKSGKSLNDLAAAKGLDPVKFSQDLQAAFAKRIDEAVQNGKMTQEKANAIKAKLPESMQKVLTRKGGVDSGNRTGKGHIGDGKRFHGSKGGFFKGVNNQVQNLLGLDQAALRAELRSGKSLAEIAKAKGISQGDLEAKIKAAIEAQLDQDVKSGKLTSEQAAKIKANLADKVKAMVTRTHTAKEARPREGQASPNQA